MSNGMQAAMHNMAGNNGSIPVKFIDGKYAPVFQHLDFLHKPTGIGLDQMSLYEFVACFKRVKSTAKDKERMEESHACDEAEAQAPKLGRSVMTRFPFSPDHPLHDTHHLQLRANQALPIIVGRIPRFPAKKPSGPVTNAYRRDAERFAAWALTVFRPWNANTGLPQDLSWNTLCDWVVDLQAQDSIVARTRLAFITHAAHGLRTNHSVDAKLKAWRFRAVTYFEHLPPKYQPAAYRNKSSYKGGEPHIFSRRATHFFKGFSRRGRTCCK